MTGGVDSMTRRLARRRDIDPACPVEAGWRIDPRTGTGNGQEGGQQIDRRAGTATGHRTGRKSSERPQEESNPHTAHPLALPQPLQEHPARLKKLLADSMLDVSILKYLLGKS